MSLANIIWFVVIGILGLWLIGLVADVGGDLIHLLLLVALVVLAYHLILGRRRA